MDYNVLNDDELDALQLIVYGVPRLVYERSNYFQTFNDKQFFIRFRLTKQSVLEVLALIENQLEYPYDLNNCVSPINQLLVALRFYATGNHLQSVADFSGIHTSTVSRIIVKVSEAIATLYNRFIKLPITQEEIVRTQEDFFNIAGFPRVIGTIDCTHVKIQSPGGEDPEIYRNRKNYFSVNVQAICNKNLIINNIVARWPGSVQDATIFNNCNVRAEFENGIYRNSVLLGDSGYSLKKYLLTPLLNPVTEGEQMYNESHIRTRNTIERLFGVLKRRFPILAYGCRLKLSITLIIIVATSILHNIARQAGEEDPPIPNDIDEEILIQVVAEE